MIAIIRRHRTIVIFLVCSAVIVTIFYLSNQSHRSTTRAVSSDELFCHDLHQKPEETLPDISDNPPDKNKRNIFFLETTCNSYKLGKLFIRARQACAVESAARLNPHMDVYLLFASPGVIKDENTESDRLLNLLSSYPNIKILHFNVRNYIRDSPVENLWTTGKIKESIYPIAHTSDILRLLTLWKFGGIYLDLDVIVIKNLEELPLNFGGAQSEDLVANGAMGFSRSGKGREYTTECLEDLSHNFDGKQWGSNGPQLITRNIFRHCEGFDTSLIVRFGVCEDFRIIPPSGFYLIPYQKWEWFLNSSLTDAIVEFAEGSSYLIHVWNKLSYKTDIPKSDTRVPYMYFATKYCPSIVQQVDDYF